MFITFPDDQIDANFFADEQRQRDSKIDED